MRMRLLSVFMFCFSMMSFAQNTSSIDFVIKNLGISVDGHFNTFSVITKFDDTNSELKNISGTITVSSIKTGIDNRDEHLLEEDYFNADKHKLITLKSESITKISENQYKVKANLKIKGITKQITITVSVTSTDGSCKIASSFKIDRRDFKVGGSSFVMSDTVKINVIHYQEL